GVSRQDKLIVPRSTDQLKVGDDVYFVAQRDHVSRSLDLFGLHGKEARRVIIVGGGNIGLHVAQQLEGGPHPAKVRLIEASKARAELAADRLSRSVVFHGDGLDQDVLREAGVGESEAVVALTNDDEVNVLVSVVAKQRGARRVLALANAGTYL